MSMLTIASLVKGIPVNAYGAMMALAGIYRDPERKDGIFGAPDGTRFPISKNTAADYSTFTVSAKFLVDKGLMERETAVKVLQFLCGEPTSLLINRSPDLKAQGTHLTLAEPILVRVRNNPHWGSEFGWNLRDVTAEERLTSHREHGGGYLGVRLREVRLVPCAKSAATAAGRYAGGPHGCRRD